ncbi:hypothetical protein [Melittangium boletus]|uniref:Uncharacterized protein n=1 Tax=Melittangium boletus DSM 14713 TaxID=1294270 RepID=A0A250I690_9BACT|nr:hypothetical protein [Melittangium boletus]ATB26681.1 hypothetical protein MEBOL_000114 [Melittangium boletus DSM 14713]
MKIEGRPEAVPTRSAPGKGRFQEQVRKGTPELAKRPPPGGTGARTIPTTVRSAPGVRALASALQVPSHGAFASAEHLGQVRRGATAEAHRLSDARGEAHQTHRERVLHRLSDLIAHELSREPGVGPPTVRDTPAARGPETPPPLVPAELAQALAGPRPEGPTVGTRASEASGLSEPRVQATLELIEKIDLFVKSQRPALAMRLGGALDATVEVERTGTREVALRIQGRRGPLAPGELTRIREALASRGLSLSALSNT